MRSYYDLANRFRGRGLRKRLPLLDHLHHFVVRRLTDRWEGVEIYDPVLLGPPKEARVHGYDLLLDEHDTLHLRDRPYEPFATELVSRLVRPGQSVIDVGANIGYYTVLLAKLVGPAGRVYAFEPDRTNVGLLRKNVERNGLRNVRIEHAAVSDRNGTTKLYIASENLGDHRLYDAYGDRRGVRVRTWRLDDYVRRQRARVSFVKIDIQGAEPAAISGMRDLLEQERDIIVLTEYAPLLIDQFGVPHERFLELLTAHGLTLYEIDESARTLTRTEAASLLARYPPGHRDTDYTNLLCTRLPLDL